MARPGDGFVAPIGFVHPVVDGKPTQFYEWYAAGRYRLSSGGGAMHRDGGAARDLYFGFDAERFYLRLDFAERTPPGAAVDLTLELLAPRALELRVHGLAPGERAVSLRGGLAEGEPPAGPAPLAGASCRVGSVLELAVPFASLGLAPGESVDLVARLGAVGEAGVTLPPEDLVRFTVPGSGEEAGMWSA